MRRIAFVAIVAAVAALLPTGSAGAASCFPADQGRVALESRSSRTHFVFSGRGWGHGVGMSQYGAQGAARLGCSVTDILTTYYRGVQIERRNTSSNIRVGLVPNAPVGPLATAATLRNESSASLNWKLDQTRVLTMPPGARWRVSVDRAGAYRVVDVASNKQQWRGGGPSRTLKLHLNGNLVRYEEKARRYLRGTIAFRSEVRSDSTGMFVTVDVPTVEAYLYGLAEMPSSFPVAALQSQAIVGRSFALKMLGSTRANCRCDVYDSIWSQVYAGYEKEGEGTNAVYGKRWVAAVDGTAEKVMVYDGAVATGNYASSHGGVSESAAFVWGGGAPYLQSADTTHWNLASDDPNRNWEATFTREELGRRFNVGLALEVRTPGPRGSSGRVGDPARGAGGLTVTGTQGEVRVSGEEARRILGTSTLKSTLFVATSPPSPIFTGTPIVGDWNGDGDDDPGWHDGSTFYLRFARHDIVAFRFGRASDTPIVGDWNGDGTDTVGVVRGNRFFLRNRHSAGGGGADIAFRYGRASDTPIAGDWNASGTDTVGLRRGNRWLLRNRHAAGSGNADIAYAYGSPPDTGVVGDWDANGTVTAGVVRGSRWYLANRHHARGADVVLDLSGT